MAQPQESSGQDLFQLSLFPLNLVLFPGMALPLHIFEERYKSMIGDCLDREVPFGILLIKEGLEVGEPADPFRIGTTARIVQSETLEEGRLNILTRGEHRFELVEITQQLPHLAGQVKILDENPGDEPSAVTADRLRQLMKARALTVDPHSPPDILGCFVLVPAGGRA